MQLKIAGNLLSFYMDESVETIEKTVASKPSTPSKSGKNAQGSMYLNKNYVGKTCVFALLEPRYDGDNADSFEYNGTNYTCYELLVRDVKEIRTTKNYLGGRVYLPFEWIGKKVMGFVLSNEKPQKMREIAEDDYLRISIPDSEHVANS